MKRPITKLLQIVTVLTGITALYALIRLPMLEGRAANLDVVSIYLDPFILYGYLSSIFFFILLYQVFLLFGYIGRDELYSVKATIAVRRIKFCAVIFGMSIVAAGSYISAFHHEDDDPAGFLAICIVGSFITMGIAIAASIFETYPKRAANSESGNGVLL
ncbi:DUF2975 domain-containing protein [Lewinella sp. JB7]|uniref:DUF2975 domain-containing protein n=1 Tax=Lewinella sp. JB7 TaxID=2962887 RepID=UPI0020C97A7A|nr:DUF2975 domain-containing protein [Lewinella sp. JB7]MCP9236033.1 DUF2975 domain-containing protein [Lewinella sp. JB7]